MKYHLFTCLLAILILSSSACKKHDPKEEYSLELKDLKQLSTQLESEDAKNRIITAKNILLNATPDPTPYIIAATIIILNNTFSFFIIVLLIIN